MLAFGLIGGVALLYLGGELLVRGGSSLALRMGVAPLMVGLTIVAMGTSTPELVVSLKAASDGYGSIALGNAVGSNIANIALILGISALIKPMDVQSKLVRLDLPLALGSALLLVLLLLDGALSRLDGALLFLGFLSYVGFTLWEARQDRIARKPASPEELANTVRPLLSVLFVAGGLAVLVVGGRIFVDAAVELAERFDVPQAVIGLTIVAIGTSLPEMATSIVAAVKGHGDLSLGNVVGSNIFNVLCILGLTALVYPFSAGDIKTADVLAMVGITLLLLPLLYTGFRVTRAEGAFLLLLYVAYVLYLLGSTSPSAVP